MSYSGNFRLWVGSTNTVGVDGLADPQDPGNIGDPDNPTVFIDDATLQLVAIRPVQQASKNLLSAPVALAYVAGTEGKYRGQFNAGTVGLVEGVVYEMEITGTEPGGLAFTWYPRAQAQKRRL